MRSGNADVWEVAREACTERQFRIFELHEKQQLSVYSIALALDLSPSTVRTHLRAAERNVRRALEADQVAAADG